MRKHVVLVLAAMAAMGLGTVAVAATGGEVAGRSAPVAVALDNATPLPRDVPYPGVMLLDVDATDTTRRILKVVQEIPVTGAGAVTLLFPQWLPGKHGPRGEIDKLAGLRFSAAGADLRWRRDPLDVYAFHVDVPSGVKSITARFEFLTATAANQGRITVTDKMMNVQWESVSLYPAGYYTRRIPVRARVTWPDGWQAATALRGTVAGSVVTYETTDYETLVDSPVFAGRHFRAVDLGHGVRLNVVADTAAELDARPDQIAAHSKLVDEAIALFGSRPFDRYEFLLAITDEMGGIGLEHHRSSENGVDTGYFLKWNDGPGDRNLLPHELTHSWNGKYRRPVKLWTPDFRTPMQDELLWVYEGQTQFWGYVLGARSGLFSTSQTLDALASIAARLDLARGRNWRPLLDTTHDPIISARRPKAWASWQRAEDYYNEGLLLWLEADAIMRAGTGGKAGMDDFARRFFGGRDGDYGTRTYDRAEVIATLGAVYPYDWAGFLAARVDRPSTQAPKAGLELGGYRLGYGDTPNSMTAQIERELKGVDQSYGVGLVVKNDGEIATVVWNSPAFSAGLAVGMKIVAVGGAEYGPDAFRAAITAARDPKKPVELIVKSDKTFRTIRLDYSLGLRYPRLEKTGEGTGSLDRLLAPKTATAAQSKP